MNNQKLKEKVSSASFKLLKEKGYIAPVDVLLEIGIIDKKRYLDWRNGRVLYLERVCNTNLSKMNLVLKTIEGVARNMKLKPSFCYYKRYGSKNKLQFSINNDKYLENRYATHYVGMQYKLPAKNNNEENNVNITTV